MKTALRYILDFLERRFPEKVVVTNERYKALESKVEALQGIQERMGKLEAEVNKFNLAMGFGLKSNGILLER